MILQEILYRIELVKDKTPYFMYEPTRVLESERPVCIGIDPL